MRTLRSVAGVVVAMLLMVTLNGAQQAPQPAAPSAPGARASGTGASRSDLGEGPWEYQTADYRIRVVKMAGGMERPWGMAFLPDGSMLVTERPGRLRIVRNGVLDPQEISGVPKNMIFNGRDYQALSFFTLRISVRIFRRFKIEMRSTYNFPFRWSVSCWKICARSPEAPRVKSLPCSS